MRTAILIFCFLIFSACTETPNDADKQESKNETPVVSNIRINNGESITDGYFLLIEKSGNSWRIVSIGQVPPLINNPTTEEILVFSKDLATVEPYYSEYSQWKVGKYNPENGEYSCYSSERNERPKYNPCDSHFSRTSSPVSNAAANIIGNVFTLGLAAASVGATYEVVTDKDKVQQVINMTDAIKYSAEYQKKLILEKELARYHQQFNLATSSEDFKKFIESYRDKDPDGLVPKASQRIPELEAAEAAESHERYVNEFKSASTASEYHDFINKYQGNDPNAYVPQAKQKYKELAGKEARAIDAKEIRELMSIVENGAILYKNDKDSLRLINTLVRIVRENDFRCDSVSAALPMILSRGYVLTCNNYDYKYDIQDKGGHWQVVID